MKYWVATFGKRLTELRKSVGFSQKKLGEELHLSQSTISCYELNKKEPPIATLKKIANYFKVSVDYLVGNTDIPNLETKVRQPEAEFFDRLQSLSPEGRKKVLYELQWLERWERHWREKYKH